MNVLEATRRYMGLKHELEPKFQKLRDLKLFVLDNSIRESTVGALRGHTLENKFDIFNQTKKLSFQHNIVGAFSRMRRVDDKFVEDIVASGEDMTNKYAFSEFYDWDFKKNRPADSIPVGLLKCKELKIPNVIMEVDLSNLPEDTEFGHAARCKLFEERFAWIKENLTHDKRILINLRDLPTAIIKCTTRAFQTIEFLSKYRPQIFAIITEEPSGKYFPEELGNMSKACTEMMRSHGYTGHFLVHVHQQWGMHNAGVLECLANGATGIWCSVSEVGAAMGHASSILTIMNLIRLGNKYVEQTYNCKHLREAAQVITQVVTGGKAHPMTPVYGARALDQVFGAGGMGSGDKVFDLAGFFDEQVPMRITTLASEQMIVTRLTRLFGKHPTFTLNMAKEMKKQMLEDHRHNRKEEYHSPVGLATLFDKAGGVKTQAMLDVLAEWEGSSLHIKGLLDEIHETWTEWDVKDHVQDDKMSFRNFYDGFLQQYFGCYTCPENEKAITAVMNVDDDDCSISWDEFSIFLKWAGKEYPKTETAEELLEIAFSKGIIPSMQEELKKASS